MGKCIRAKISPRVNFAGSDRFFLIAPFIAGSSLSFSLSLFSFSFSFSFSFFFCTFQTIATNATRRRGPRTSLSFLSSSTHRNERNVMEIQAYVGQNLFCFLFLLFLSRRKDNRIDRIAASQRSFAKDSRANARSVSRASENRLHVFT